MKLDIGDFLVFVGGIMLLVGLYLLDWRLALAAGGGMLIILGSIRLRLSHERTETNL